MSSTDTQLDARALPVIGARVWTWGILIGIVIAGMALRYLAHLLLGGAPGLDAYAAHLCNWDCKLYAAISEQGYPRGDANSGLWAFFPVVPLVLAALERLLQLSAPVAALVLGSVCSLATVAFARPLFDANQRGWWLFCVLMLAGPFSYLYATGMSEPVFMMLSAAVFSGLKRRQWTIVALAALLMGATRITGIVIGLPILVELSYPLFGNRERLRSASGWRELALPIVALAAAPIGLLAHMSYLWAIAGDPFAFFHAQANWGRSLGNPIATLGFLVATFADPTHGYRLFQAIFTVLALIAGVTLAWRRQFGMSLFTVAIILISASMGTISLARFVMGLLPVSYLAADVLGTGWIRFAIATVLALALCVVLTMLWMGGSPILT